MRIFPKSTSKVLAVATLSLVACSPHTTDGAASAAIRQAEARHSASGLPVIPLTVRHGDKTFTFRVEVAKTSEEQAKGLMFRTEMGADEGMLFPMNPPRMASFWMRNTVIPLDLIFIGVDGHISNIATNAEPYSERPLTSVGEVKGVLELNGGRAAELGIAPGDRVDW